MYASREAARLTQLKTSDQATVHRCGHDHMTAANNSEKQTVAGPGSCRIGGDGETRQTNISSERRVDYLSAGLNKNPLQGSVAVMVV